MKRRDFITLLGGAAAAWPLAARAQLPGMPVVGLLTNASFEGFADGLRAFRSGLGEAGFVEGRNLAIGSYQAEGDDNRLSALAAELVQRGVNVIVTNGTATAAAKAATASIPIVFFTGADPVALGLVASLNRPGGNLTGVAVFADFLGPKRLELLHEMVPAVTNIAVLVNPANPAADRQMKDLQTAAHTFGLLLHVLNASAEQDFDAAFATLVKQRASALLISPHPLFTGKSELLAGLAVRHAVPAIYQWREFAATGGLMSYGGNLTEPFRQIGVYTGRILKGEKPADLPVQQITKVELVINLKTAKALGLTVPLALLTRADEVIE